MGYSESNCFPESWIGKEPVKVGDGAYYIGNDSTKQVILPSGHGKGVYATWLPNGVLRVDTDTNGVKLFFVGSQRFFPAYGDETEPHDINRYEEAVRECQRLREEEKERNNPQKRVIDNDKKRKESQTAKKDNSSWGVGAIIGSAVSAVKDFQSIDDSSFLENFRYENSFGKKMEEDERKYKEENEKWIDFINRRDKEIERLRLFEQHFINKEQKKRIFSNLHNLFTVGVENVPVEMIFKMLGIFDPSLQSAVIRAKNRYQKSLEEVGPSEKFYNNWAEVFYLIEEGYPLQDKHLDEFARNIYDTCCQTISENEKESKNIAPFYECLIPWYKKLNHAYWGHKFDKDPREDIVKERLNYLEHASFENGDKLDNGYIDLKKLFPEFNIEEDNSTDEDNTKNKKAKSTSATAASKKKDNKVKESHSTDNNGKYEDLNSIDFKKDNGKEDYKEPKNAFDIITKSKNKRIANKKEKWNDAMWNLDHKLKKNVLRYLTNIEKDVVKLLKLEEELKELLDSGKSEGFWGFGGDKNVKKKKSDIKLIKEKMVDHKGELEDAVEELRDCEEDIKDYQEDLYELTGLEKYANYKPIEGKGITIANQLIKCIKDADSQTLKRILELE